jgi:hypothetical protein
VSTLDALTLDVERVLVSPRELVVRDGVRALEAAPARPPWMRSTAGVPNFPLLSERMLHGRRGIATTLFVFDVLAVEAIPMLTQPDQERRAVLEELELGRRTAVPWREVVDDAKLRDGR